jgi:hypothetical protein
MKLLVHPTINTWGLYLRNIVWELQLPAYQAIWVNSIRNIIDLYIAAVNPDIRITWTVKWP